jgi:N-acetylglucosaminyldiphosphoundecaprenol N-acetyl-beta-D-mannosaminyltransferase
MDSATASMPEITKVLGLPIHLSSNYASGLMSQLSQGAGSHVVTLNAEMVMQAEQNQRLAQIIHRAELVIPDGAGVVLYLKCKGYPVQRCPGIELAEALLREIAKLGATGSAFFYGSEPGVAEQAARVMQSRFPGLAIAGVQHGFLPPEQHLAFNQRLQALHPSLILVGLGVPRQELWIAEHRHLCPQAIWVGVGGSLDIWAGVKTRAPQWLRNNHLEWTYRLYKEPWRWRRMLSLPHFVWRAMLEMFEQMVKR